MIYEVSKEFVKVDETNGTLQNTSNISTLEMSHSDEPNSGIFIPPRRSRAFDDIDGSGVWIRCIDGTARARVVPFKFVNNQSGVIIAGERYSIARSDDISEILNNIFGLED